MGGTGAVLPLEA